MRSLSTGTVNRILGHDDIQVDRRFRNLLGSSGIVRSSGLQQVDCSLIVVRSMLRVLVLVLDGSEGTYKLQVKVTI